MKRRYWILLGVMVALVPLGLLTDAPAWGEWGREHYAKLLGFIPRGMAAAPEGGGVLPDYSVPGLGAVSGYYLSALVGVALLAGVYWLLYRMVKRR
jgi:hypothetical protein